MYLHNNLIAEHYSDGRILINVQGGLHDNQGTTQRYTSCSIYQRNFQWYLNGHAWNGNWIEVTA